MASALALQLSNQLSYEDPYVGSRLICWLEHCSAKAEAMGSNPVEVSKFFSG